MDWVALLCWFHRGIRKVWGSVERPAAHVPEDAHAVVAHDGVGGDAVQAAGSDVVGVDIADEGVGRVIGELLLEQVIVLSARFTESADNQLNRKRSRGAAHRLHDAVNRGMVQSIHADGRYFTNPASIDFSHRISSPFARKSL